MIGAEEALEAFDVLAESLRKLRYNWILDQIDETLNFGKMRPTKAIDFSVEEDLEARYIIANAQLAEYETETHQKSSKRARKKPKGRPVDIERIEPFTPHERLSLLLEAIERVFVASEKMERATLERFVKIDSDRTKEVVIAFQAEAGERTRVVAPSTDRSHSAKSLSSLLQALNEVMQ
jgi:hypothetical protein